MLVKNNLILSAKTPTWWEKKDRDGESEIVTSTSVYFGNEPSLAGLEFPSFLSRIRANVLIPAMFSACLNP